MIGMMKIYANKRIILGITGGIAAYKAAELTRRLCELGAEVRVVMTRAAQAFVGSLTFQALSGKPVHSELLDPGTESVMGHIELARWADIILVAPASANFIARLTHGLADDLLATLCLATQAPLVLAPAMNQQMWQASTTQDNCALLLRRGVVLLGPASGSQACGEIGPGRMLEPSEIIQGLGKVLSPQLLNNKRVLITAGPTREALDPIRFLSNRSSGKMGYALARASMELGAEVTLISGPVSINRPYAVQVIDVESAAGMLTAVNLHVQYCDIFIATAAVADYRFAEQADQKLKKSSSPLSFSLVPTVDILQSVAQLERKPFTVGFAAETQNVAEYARFKLRNKALDMIVANDVSRSDIGFESEENQVVVIWQDGQTAFNKMDKQHLARRLIRLIVERYDEKYSTQIA